MSRADHERNLAFKARLYLSRAKLKELDIYASKEACQGGLGVGSLSACIQQPVFFFARGTNTWHKQVAQPVFLHVALSVFFSARGMRGRVRRDQFSFCTWHKQVQSRRVVTSCSWHAGRGFVPFLSSAGLTARRSSSSCTKAQESARGLCTRVVHTSLKALVHSALQPPSRPADVSAYLLMSEANVGHSRCSVSGSRSSASPSLPSSPPWCTPATAVGAISVIRGQQGTSTTGLLHTLQESLSQESFTGGR